MLTSDMTIRNTIRMTLEFTLARRAAQGIVANDRHVLRLARGPRLRSLRERLDDRHAQGTGIAERDTTSNDSGGLLSCDREARVGATRANYGFLKTSNCVIVRRGVVLARQIGE